MKAYRVVWLAVVLPLSVVGAGVTFVLSPAALACLFSSFAVVGAIVTMCIDSEHETRSPRGRTRRVVTGGAAGGAAAGAFAGFTVVLGASVFLLALLVLVSSPYAVGAYLRWLGSSPAPPAGRLDAVVRAFAFACPEYTPFQPPPALGDLTDEQLCDSWWASCTALHQERSAARKVATVAERQRYLDEFERRNPQGIAAWLATGDAASGSPLPYLGAIGGSRPAINWDDLTRGQDW